MKNMETMTRQQALAAGLNRYYTGKPCPHGHVAMRRVSGACCECARLDKLAWRKANPEFVKVLKLAEQKRNREKANERNRRYAATHREQIREKNIKWAKENPAASSAKQARRRSRKLCATPAWADHGKIDRAYEMVAEYRSKGINAHVDHIVPLQGRMVCGLHVHYNLQIIDGKYNLSKSNKF